MSSDQRRRWSGAAVGTVLTPKKRCKLKENIGVNPCSRLNGICICSAAIIILDFWCSREA